MMNWKGCGRKRSWFKVLSWNLPGGTEEFDVYRLESITSYEESTHNVIFLTH